MLLAFQPGGLAQRCRYRTDEQLALIKSLWTRTFRRRQLAEAGCGPEGFPEGLLDQQSAHSLSTFSAAQQRSSYYYYYYRCSFAICYQPFQSQSCQKASSPVPFSRNPFAGVLPASREDRERLVSEQFAVEEATRSRSTLSGLLLRSEILFEKC